MFRECMFLAKSTFMIDYPRWDVADGRMIWPLLGQFQGLPKQCAIICGKKNWNKTSRKVCACCIVPNVQCSDYRWWYNFETQSDVFLLFWVKIKNNKTKPLKFRFTHILYHFYSNPPIIAHICTDTHAHRQNHSYPFRHLLQLLCLWHSLTAALIISAWWRNPPIPLTHLTINPHPPRLEGLTP